MSKLRLWACVIASLSSCWVAARDYPNHWVSDSAIAYTLYGSKPVSFLVMTGAELAYFQSVESQLQSEDIVVAQRGQLGFRDAVYWIRRSEFRQVVDGHPQLVRRVFGQALDGQALLASFLAQSGNLYEFLHEDEELYGILLGFGDRNSSLFARRKELGAFEVVHYGRVRVDPPLSFPEPSEGYASIHAECSCLQQQPRQFTTAQLPAMRLSLPRFVVFERDEETASKQAHYEVVRGRVTKLLESKSAFEILTQAPIRSS